MAQDSKENDQNPSNSNWERKTLEKVLLETVKEQRRRRRWSIFFKLLYLLIFALFIFVLIPSKGLRSGYRFKPHTALIEVNGVISPNSIANADDIVAGLTKAFKDPYTKGVILRIDSPGGAPVQSAYVYNAIMRLRKKHPSVKVYAVCTDICASGAYYIAAAANDIYANPSSIVGSIGVLMNGFGFVGTLEKLGIQRRLIISGDEKGFLDPFSPLKPKDLAYAQKMLNIVHQNFINAVKQGRGQRLKITPEIFSGLAWTGVQAKQLGLIDGFASPGDVARNIIKAKHIVDYTKKPNIFERFGRTMGASFFHSFATQFGLDGAQLR
ncbi:MAG: S49 family peptidase [Pseudomonadota bacterium]